MVMGTVWTRLRGGQTGSLVREQMVDTVFIVQSQLSSAVNNKDGELSDKPNCSLHLTPGCPVLTSLYRVIYLFRKINSTKCNFELY